VRALLIVLALALPASAQAAPPQTGFEQRDGASFTTHEEELGFLAAVGLSERVRVEVIGTSQEGRALHLVQVGGPPVGAPAARSRPTAMLVCSQHGNEPAGREACLKLLRDLAYTEDPALVSLLATTSLLFVPTANPDGRAANTRENAATVDVNRDHVTLDTPEARAVAAVVRDWEPDVMIDLHEYGPSQPVVYDDSVLWLWPRNLNTDQAVHDLAIDLGRDYLVPSAAESGFGADEYGQYEVADNDVAQTAGDGDEGIMRNAMGLRHVLGILVETRVDADVRQSPSEALDAAMVARRRVDSHGAVLRGLLRFMRERGRDAMRVTAEAAERKAAEGAAQNAPVYFGGADNAEPAPEDVVSPPPCGYLLDAAQLATLGPRLALHGISSEDGFVPLAQRAEPLIPLLLDARGTRHVVEATARTEGCPAPVPVKAADPPRAPAPRCVQPRTVAMKLPRVRGKRVRVRVTVGGQRVRVRRGVAYVRLRERQRGKLVAVRIAQVHRVGSERRVKRSMRILRVCMT
jgi:hypothetical protein